MKRPVKLAESLPVQSLDISLIDDGDNISRSYYHGIPQLATSLKDYAEIITVCPEVNGRYTCIAGHRRLRAHRLNGVKQVLCLLVHEPDPAKRALMTASSNVRDNGTAYDWLMQCHTLHVKYKHAPAVIATTVHKSEQYVKQCLIVVEKLNPDILGALKNGEDISIGTLIDWSSLSHEAQWRAYEYRNQRTGVRNGGGRRLALSRAGMLTYRDELMSGDERQRYAAEVIAYLLGERERP